MTFLKKDEKDFKSFRKTCKLVKNISNRFITVAVSAPPPHRGLLPDCADFPWHADFTNLTSLTMRISCKFPAALWTMTKLASLCMICDQYTNNWYDRDCMFSTVAGLGNLTALKTLAFKNFHRMQKLPEEVFKLTQLESLEFESEDFEELHQDIGKLKCLKFLRMIGCMGMETMPPEIGQLTSLQTLRSEGEFLHLPPEIGQLTGLRNLNLSACTCLQVLPAEIGNLTGLTYLDIGYTRIGGLPVEIKKLKMLEKLVLTETNVLQVLAPEIGELNRLKKLDLRRMIVVGLPVEICKLSELEILDLRNCFYLEHISQEIEQLTALKKLYVCGCESLDLTELSERTSRLASLQIIHDADVDMGDTDNDEE